MDDALRLRADATVRYGLVVSVETEIVDDKRMKLRYAGVCRLCGVDLPARADAIYERATRTVRCVECPTGAAAVEVQQEPQSPQVEFGAEDAGVAGSSARREYERRKAKDEERLGVRLDSLASETLAVLHDRSIPGSKANIDHIAITAAGIWVIDAKRYKGRPVLRIEGGILRPRVEKVLVGRRDCTKLVDGVLKQIDLVRDVVGDIPVTGALCFVEGGGPVDVPPTREALASHFKPA